MADTVVDEGKSDVAEIQPDKATGKYPETVPWNQYVGIKESLGKKLDSANQRLTTLEEQLKTAVKPEDHKKIMDELVAVKATAESKDKELQAIRDASTAEKRNILKQKGVPEEEVKSMSAGELNAAVKAIGYVKPGADMGSGGGATVPKGSPMELARQAYQNSPKK